MTTALLEFLPVGTIPIKIWLHRLQNEFHLTMASYCIIYSATTRGEKFSAVEMFQLLFPKEKNKQTNNKTKQNHKFGNIFPRTHGFKCSLFLPMEVFFHFYGGQKTVLQTCNTDLNQTRKNSQLFIKGS